MNAVDHGTLSGIRRTSSARQERRHAAGIERTIDTAMADIRARRDAGLAEAKAAYDARTAPVPFTPEQLAQARAVRTGTGWHIVVKVNAKTVTVRTPYSWTDRYAIGKILEVRA